MPSRFVCAMFALVVAGLAPAFAQTYEREPLSTFLQDPDKVRSLLIGVQTMKARNDAPRDSAEYRTSWEYWAAIHGYTGPAPGTPVAQLRQSIEDRFPELAPFYASFYEGLEDSTPPDALAEEVWATCRHGGPPQGDVHFLTWHRMYLYFFERVLREASGDPDFALPYWDYTEPGAPPDEPWRMPGLFAVPTLGSAGQEIPNPLFEPRRTPGFGRTVQLDVAQTNVDPSLQLDQFFQFSAGLELGVHGYVHCAVGNACLAPMMGIVPLAGGEPIFWHHHANIDRLLSCWLAHHGPEKLPADQAWLDRSFPFVDENGDRVEMKVAELFDPSGRLDYVYDDVSGEACFRSPPPTVVASSDVQLEAEADSGGATVILAHDVVLTGMGNIVPFGPALDRADAMQTFETAPGSPAGRVLLSLREIGVESQPAASIAFELVSNTSGERRRIGSLNFFAFGDTEHAHDDAERTPDALTFDVTNALTELGVRGLEDVVLDIRAINLLPSEAAMRAAAEHLEAAPPAAVNAVNVLEALRNAPADQLAEFIGDSGVASGVMTESADAGPTAEDTAAALERIRRANITFGEIVLSVGP